MEQKEIKEWLLEHWVKEQITKEDWIRWAKKPSIPWKLLQVERLTKGKPKVVRLLLSLLP